MPWAPRLPGAEEVARAATPMLGAPGRARGRVGTRNAAGPPPRRRRPPTRRPLPVPTPPAGLYGDVTNRSPLIDTPSDFPLSVAVRPTRPPAARKIDDRAHVGRGPT